MFSRNPSDFSLQFASLFTEGEPSNTHLSTKIANTSRRKFSIRREIMPGRKKHIVVKTRALPKRTRTINIKKNIRKKALAVRSTRPTKSRGVRVAGSRSKGARMAPLTYSMPAPKVGFGFYPIKEPGGIGIRGTDLLATISNPSISYAEGDQIYTTLLNPLSLGGKRMAILGTLWEYFKFVNVQILFRPAAPTTVTGSMVGFFDPDVSDTVDGGVAGVQEAYTHLGAQTTNLWESCLFNTPFWKPPVSKYFTEDHGTDDRFVDQWKFYLMAATAIASGQLIGQLYVHYDIILTGPTVPNSECPLFYAHTNNDNSTPNITGAGRLLNWFASPTVVSGMQMQSKILSNTAGAVLDDFDFAPSNSACGFQMKLPPGVWYVMSSMAFQNSVAAGFTVSDAFQVPAGSTAVVNTLLTNNPQSAGAGALVYFNTGGIVTIPSGTDGELIQIAWVTSNPANQLQAVWGPISAQGPDYLVAFSVPQGVVPRVHKSHREKERLFFDSMHKMVIEEISKLPYKATVIVDKESKEEKHPDEIEPSSGRRSLLITSEPDSPESVVVSRGDAPLPTSSSSSSKQDEKRKKSNK